MMVGTSQMVSRNIEESAHMQCAMTVCRWVQMLTVALYLWGVTQPFESLIKDTDVLSPENCRYTPDFALSFEIKKSVCKKGDTVLRMMGLCNSPNS